MLAIRLQRIGRHKRPSYRVVVSEKSKDMYGVHKEILGHYDPKAQPKVIKLNAERIKYWMSVGAQPSNTVHNLLVSQKIIDAAKVRAWKLKKKQKNESASETADTLQKKEDKQEESKETVA